MSCRKDIVQRGEVLIKMLWLVIRVLMVLASKQRGSTVRIQSLLSKEHIYYSPDQMPPNGL